MNINKTELLRALELVKPGLSNKETIEQSTFFAFIKGRVVTFNDEISLSHAIPNLEIEGAIKAEELYKLLNKIKAEELELSIEGSELLITSGRTKAGLTLQEEVKLPLDEIAAITKWKKIPDGFIKHLKFCLPSCSRDMSRPVITGVHINQKGVIEASDGFRITRCITSEDAFPTPSFILPSSATIEVLKLNPVKISYAANSGWAHFQSSEGTILSCRIFEETYPDIEQFMDVEGTHITLPKSTQQVLDRAEVFSKRDNFIDESVILTLENNRLKIRSESEVGWFEEEINIKYLEDKISINITPYLLRGILSETNDCLVAENCLKFAGVDWEYLTLLRG